MELAFKLIEMDAWIFDITKDIEDSEKPRGHELDACGVVTMCSHMV